MENDIDYNLILIVVGAALLVTIAIFIIVKVIARKKTPRYKLKPCLLTATEMKYYNALTAMFGNDYCVLPQINLASVIDKEDAGYRTELFRNVDFGLFDKALRPILLIEINDNTHMRKDRRLRDEKVHVICKKARIPLVTFWTKDGFDERSIYTTVKKYL